MVVMENNVEPPDHNHWQQPVVVVSSPSVISEQDSKLLQRPNHNDTLLEGWLWKQGSRVQFWHERYFRFIKDQSRLEYALSSAGPAKAVLCLSELTDLRISEIYVAPHKKQSMVYCVKLTWTCSSTNYSTSSSAALLNKHNSNNSLWSSPRSIVSDSNYHYDDESDPGTARQQEQRCDHENHHHEFDVLSGVTTESFAESYAAKNHPSSNLRQRRRRSTSSTLLRAQFVVDRFRRKPLLSPPLSCRDMNAAARSVGDFAEGHALQREKPLMNGQKNVHHDHRRRCHTAPYDDGGGENEKGMDAAVPAEVQVDHSVVVVNPHPLSSSRSIIVAQPPCTTTTTTPPPSPSRRVSLVPTQRELLLSSSSSAAASIVLPPYHSHQTKTAYERQRDEDLQFLQSEFWAQQQEKKRLIRKRVTTGTKIAVVTGAAVGVTIVTAGIGLVTGLVVLGVGAAAGGGSAAAAVGATWRKKVSGELVLASADYETIRTWKTIFDAFSKDSDSIQRTTWGQLFISDGRKSTVALLPRTLVFASNNEKGMDIQRAADHPCALKLGEEAKWVPLNGGWVSLLGCCQGLRIFREEPDDRQVTTTASSSSTTPQSSDNNMTAYDQARCLIRRVFEVVSYCTPMKAQLVLNASPLDAFLCLMSYGRVIPPLHSTQPLDMLSEHNSSFSVVETIDDHTDIIHLALSPLHLIPCWTQSRDFCLFRYWRLEPDGSYIVCYQSIDHPRCPPSPPSLYVRGKMHQVITIAPQKLSYRRRMHHHSSSFCSGPGRSGPGPGPGLTASQSSLSPLVDCLITSVAQVDPKGWVPTRPLSCFSNQSYSDAFTVLTVSHIRNVRDAIDQDRFMPVFVEDALPKNNNSNHNISHNQERSSSLLKKASTSNMNFEHDDDDALEDDTPNYDYTYAANESSCRSSFGGADLDLLLCHLPPLRPEKWAVPDPNSFRVRGPSYKTDRLKINAGGCIGRLVVVDMIWSEKAIESGFTVHPKERMQVALRKEEMIHRTNGRASSSSMPPFVFVVTIMLPGPPYYYGVFYFAVDNMSTINGKDGTASSNLCREFFFGDDDRFRDRTFKMIPQIVQGNFIVRKAVGDTPAIMGTKLRQLYVKSERCFEIILDCGSSSIATGVIGLSLSYAKMLVIDMAFLFEGDSPSTLPERLLGAVRMKQPEFGPHLRKVEPP